MKARPALYEWFYIGSLQKNTIKRGAFWGPRPSYVRLQIWSHLVQSVHAELVAHEAGGVGWESSEQDGDTAFVHGSDSLFLH